MKRLDAIDFTILLMVVLVPLICIGVFFLPIDIQHSLAMRSDNPNPLTFITSIFVHGNVEHLIGNILVFLMVSTVLYMVNKLSQGETFFLYSLVLIILLLPLCYGTVFLVLNNVYFHFSFSSFGLSLVDGGLVGLVVPTLMYLLSQESSLKLNKPLFFLSLVFFTSAVILLPYAWSSFYTVPLLVLLAGIGILLSARGLLEITNFAKTGSKKDKFKALSVLFILLMYFIFLTMLFPSNILDSSGNITNILAHYFGVFFGLFVGMLIGEIQMAKVPQLRERSIT
jgi:hypothetical protein